MLIFGNLAASMPTAENRAAPQGWAGKPPEPARSQSLKPTRRHRPDRRSPLWPSHDFLRRRPARPRWGAQTKNQATASGNELRVSSTLHSPRQPVSHEHDRLHRKNRGHDNSHDGGREPGGDAPDRRRRYENGRSQAAPSSTPIRPRPARASTIFGPNDPTCVFQGTSLARLAQSASPNSVRWPSEAVGPVFSTASEGHRTVKPSSTPNFGARSQPHANCQ